MFPITYRYSGWSDRAANIIEIEQRDTMAFRRAKRNGYEVTLCPCEIQGTGSHGCEAPKSQGFNQWSFETGLYRNAEGVTIADARLHDNPIILRMPASSASQAIPSKKCWGAIVDFSKGAITDHDTLERLRSSIRRKHACTVQCSLPERRDAHSGIASP